MTYVRFIFTPSEIGFKDAINEEFVQEASTAIRNNLEGVVAQHDDHITREKDDRRTHDPLSSSSWMIKYVHNQLIITNTISNSVSQMSALKNGNGKGPICAHHPTKPRILKGRSSKDRHRNKTLAGDIGLPYPPMLKFYSKKYGMWMYRHCVKPISTAVIEDFNKDIERAVLDGLESTVQQLEDYEDDEEVGTNEHLDELPMDMTVEEMSKSFESEVKTYHKSIEYQEAKAEEPEVENDQITEDVHKDMGIVQTLSTEINKSINKVGLLLRSIFK